VPTHQRVAPPEHRLDLPELRRLEAARRLQAVAEPEELAGRHRLQHVDLGDGHLEDRERPPEGVQRVGGVAVLQPALEVGELVEQLLEPQLVHLVDDDEQHLVVLARARPLCAEDLVERKVRRVGEGGGRLGHGVTSSTCRAAGLARSVGWPAPSHRGPPPSGALGRVDRWARPRIAGTPATCVSRV
jgi:hypothetical protein